MNTANCRFSRRPANALTLGAISLSRLLLVSVSFLILLRVESGALLAAPDDPEEAPPEEPVVEEDEQPLPTIDKMEIPSFQRLMKGPPVDWIVMHSKKVLEVEPLYPRPGTMRDVEQKIAKMTRKVGAPPESDVARRKRLALYYLPITLMEGEERDYRLHIKFIRDITYYEDLMLSRIDRLLDEKKVRQAWELLTALEERQEGWPGAASRKERLLFTEAQVRLDERQPQHALALLEALFERNREYNGLEAEFGVVGDRL